ncbi:MAG: FxsA family protein [Halanaerobiales bacterium]
MKIFIRLLLLFTIVPIVELALLIEIGSYIGVLPTIFLVAITGIVGVTLARKQGLIVVTKIRRKLSRGEIPTSDLIEGLLILIGGVTLLTPGVLTDITGFLLILPFTRPLFAKLASSMFKKYVDKDQFKTTDNFTFHNSYNEKNNYNQKDYVDIEYEEEDDETKNRK